MARVTHVKHARQRYATVKVLDDDGQPKKVPVLRKDGTPKTTKRGSLVFLTLTQQDRSKPLPLIKCGHCGKDIEVGTPYKWIEPYGRGVLSRHADCPTWQVWEYSNSLSARIAQIQYDNDPSDINEPSDMKDWADGFAQAIRELAEEKEESANNMEEGFGHETEQSNELKQISEDLNSWADEVEGIQELELPEPDEVDCDNCDGTGTIEAGGDGVDSDESETCTECNGTGKVDGEAPTEEQMDAWREEARDKMQELLDACPV